MLQHKIMCSCYFKSVCDWPYLDITLTFLLHVLIISLFEWCRAIGYHMHVCRPNSFNDYESSYIYWGGGGGGGGGALPALTIRIYCSCGHAHLYVTLVATYTSMAVSLQ